jgi:prepilin-type N-terminal cleavage/methylation domain-containing protein
MKNKCGFTLVEVLVYLGLFAILMTGMLATAFSMLEASDRDQTRVLMQGEGDFIVAKINWALTGIKDINSPFPGGSGSILSVNKWIGSGVATTVDFRIPPGTEDMAITFGGNDPVVLNNSNIQIENLLFTHDYSGSNQEDVSAGFTIKARTFNGMFVSQDFYTIKYMRK